VSTGNAAVLLWLEACVVALGYAALGAAPARHRVAVLAAALVGHAIVVAAASRDAGGPGDAAALIRVRGLFAAEGLAAWGLAGALARTRLDRGLGAAIAAAVVLALVVAPAPGEAAAQAIGDAEVRSAAYAVSPPFAASAVLGLDVMHEPGVYGRVPAAVMEMHMTSWIWTAGSFSLAGLLLGFVSLARRPRRLGMVALVAAVALAGCKKEGEKKEEKKEAPPAAKQEEPKPEPAKPDAKAAIDKGVEFLVKSRSEDGLIGGHPGTTALAVLAIVSADVPKDDPRVAPSIAALAKLAKPDGAIVDKDFPVYVTAISVLAFQRAGAHPELVEKAQRWLADKQFSDANGVSTSNVNYGGIGYGTDQTHPDADLSNMHFALDALAESTLKDRADVLARAQKFLERCQNRSESNDQEWATDDGGFVYKPGASKAGGTASSASMTYAGVASYLYADVAKDDPRVAAAREWLKDNYSVDENPGLGQKGLYYHFHMMGRTLGMLGERTIVDGDGREHDWPAELTAKLVGLQKPDGSWANPDATYWEDNPAIATARALLALEHAAAATK
jgi:squalene-hopene/tetraprenyl-beta-curcumene cyclase